MSIVSYMARSALSICQRSSEAARLTPPVMCMPTLWPLSRSMSP